LYYFIIICFVHIKALYYFIIIFFVHLKALYYFIIICFVHLKAFYYIIIICFVHSVVGRQTDNGGSQACHLLPPRVCPATVLRLSTPQRLATASVHQRWASQHSLD
jgi:hypothetical protein